MLTRVIGSLRVLPGFEKWRDKIKVISEIANVNVSDLLEREDIESGSDLADYLIKFDL